MKVGIVGPIWLQIPPNGYGGTEEVVYNLVNGLSDLRYNVTLFGPGTAKVNANLVATVNKPLIDNNIPLEDISNTIYHLTKAFDLSHTFDILHIHLNTHHDYIALPLAVYSKCPVLFTLHFEASSLYKKYPDRLRVLEKYGKFPFTSISRSQQRHTSLNYIDTIYNSLNADVYPFQNQPQDYFVWLGKVKKEKGTLEAIKAAKLAGVKLILMGAVDYNNPEMLEYYNKEVKPHVDGKQIIMMHNVGLPKKAEILGKAKGFLNPIQWEEPFGLVMIESQATGTPVISFNRGAAAELIENNKTGFLVDSIEQMVSKMMKVNTIDRINCRELVVKRFSNVRMIEGYVSAYSNAINNWEKCRASLAESLKILL